MGSAKLEYDDPTDSDKKIVLILIVFENAPVCTVNEKNSETGVGK